LQAEIERLFDQKPSVYTDEDFLLFERFKAALNEGRVRAAEPCPETRTGWRVNTWVKKGILLGFRIGAVIDMSIDSERQPFFDKSTFPVKRFTVESGVRIVPGGSSIRDGCYIGKGVVCMPPMFINVGAWVDEGTMVDSHAVVGSCAQVGKNCHISAASQIGGVLEPVGAMPVIWWAAIAAFTKEPSSSGARCSARARSSTARPRSTTWFATPSTAPPMTSRSSSPKRPW